jgi:magnesium transporter
MPMMRSFPPASPADSAVWVDLLDPSQDEIEAVERAYGIKVPKLTALSEIESSSRLRAEGSTLYMSAPLIAGTDTPRWESAPTGFILSPRVLVTVRYARLDLFDAVEADIAQTPDLTPALAFAMLLEGAVDRAADHLEHAADMVAKVAQTIFSDEVAKAGLASETRVLRDTIRTIGRANDRASRVRYMFLSLGRIASFTCDRCSPKLPQPILDRLGAVSHDIASLDEFEVSLTGRVQLLQDAATGLISIEQNDVVKVLTVASVVGIPPVLIAGIYGMNFKNMPELGWSWGYPYALALCLVSAVVPYLWFKWRDWI